MRQLELKEKDNSPLRSQIEARIQRQKLASAEPGTDDELMILQTVKFCFHAAPQNQQFDLEALLISTRARVAEYVSTSRSQKNGDPHSSDISWIVRQHILDELHK